MNEVVLGWKGISHFYRDGTAVMSLASISLCLGKDKESHLVIESKKIIILGDNKMTAKHYEASFKVPK